MTSVIDFPSSKIFDEVSPALVLFFPSGYEAKTNQFVNPLSNARRRWLKSLYFCVYIARLKDHVHEWVTFACDGTGPDDESKRTKRGQG